MPDALRGGEDYLQNTPQFRGRSGESQRAVQPAVEQAKPVEARSDNAYADEARNALLGRITNGDMFQAASAARALNALGGGVKDYGSNAVSLTNIDEQGRQFDMGQLMNTRNPVQGESLFNKLADRQGVARQAGPSFYDSGNKYGAAAGGGDSRLAEPTAAQQYQYSYGAGGAQGTANNVGARSTTPSYQYQQGTANKGITDYSQYADGGLVEGALMGYADGGMVGTASNAMDMAGASAPQDPTQALAASYPAYLKAMKGGKTKPMSIEAYMKAAMAVVSQKMQQQQQRGAPPGAGAGPAMGFADGGGVDIGGKLLDGPGHGRSDSIPAMIDGHQPAAVSKGEFVVPKNVVEYFGTKHFDALLEKARMAMKKGQAKGGTA